MSRRNSQPYIVGIDPGKTGGVSCLRMNQGNPPTLLFTEDLPYLDARVDGLALSAMLTNWGDIALAIVEKASPMPSTDGRKAGMGVTGAFTYGLNYGIILGTLQGLVIPVQEVRPADWKKAMSLTGRGLTPREIKEASRAKARTIFPVLAERFARAKDDGRAESALIALYGAQRGDAA